jgi:hypothetical protein
MTPATTPALTFNNGVSMPALGLCVFRSPPEETTAAVETALRDGYRLIDTAAAYDNEREVGEGIRRSGVDRDEIFVTTKLWISDYGYDAAQAGFDASLRRPGLDHVDRYPISRCPSRTASAPTRAPRRSSPAAGPARSASRTSARSTPPADREHRRRAGGQPGRAAPLLHGPRCATLTPSWASPPGRGRHSAASWSTCPALTSPAAR